jgi:CRISPR-associated endonuclease/helicase Cas3
MNNGSDIFRHRLRSHPDPEKTLYRHLRIVGNSCREKILSYQVVSTQVGEHHNDTFTDMDVLEEIAYIIGITHDFAKATTYFQNSLDDRTKKTIYSRHSGLSALFTFHVISNMIPDKPDLQVLSYVTVKRHHGNLKNLLTEEANIDNFDLEVFEKQIQDITSIQSDGYCAYKELQFIYNVLLPKLDLERFVTSDLEALARRVCRTIKNTIRNNENLDNYFLILSLYSALQEADKSDASGIIPPPRIKDINLEMVSDFRTRSFSAQSSKISRLREVAYLDVLNSLSKCNLNKQRIFSITLPTGFGKTIAGLASSLLIRCAMERELRYSPRIIYSLPFLSIIEQNAAVIDNILSPPLSLVSHSKKIPIGKKSTPSDVLLIHHHLADSYYKSSKQDDEAETIDRRASIYLVEGWNSEVIITTFVQFFESIITNRKNMIRKFNNLRGSVIILDEIQAIPPKYWRAIDNALTYLCDNLGCWIILMTATKPVLLEDSIELANYKKYQFEDRVRFSLNIEEESVNNAVQFIMSEIRSKNSVLVVLNTIGQSKEIYRLVRNELDDSFGASHVDEYGIRHYENLQLVYLSSTILPKTRHIRISNIKTSSEDRINQVKTLVISTQVVEAGVDIDMESVIRDFAPLDSIVQSAGRCNRNSRPDYVGLVTVMKLRDDATNRYYSNYVYDSILINATNQIFSSLESTSINERTMLEQITRYFGVVMERKSQENTIDEMVHLRFDIIGDFQLIEGYVTMQVFLEIDSAAIDARNIIENSSNNSKRMREVMLDLKETLNNNIINVRKPAEIEIAESLPYISGTEIRYVPKDDLDIWYDPEMGFNPRMDALIERRVL